MQTGWNENHNNCQEKKAQVATKYKMQQKITDQ